MESSNTPSLQEEVTRLHADICSALADPRRILILYALNEKTRNVSDLADELGMSQPAGFAPLEITT